MYTIGQVSSMFNMPISTLRYYDKQGLFSNLKRSSGIRRFEDHDLDRIRIIECLKRSGLEISDIRRYMELCEEGSSTYPERRELFARQQEAVEDEIAKLEQVKSMLRFKCWYYEQAIQDGNEDRIRSMLPDSLPEDIQKLYDHARGISAEQS